MITAKQQRTVRFGLFEVDLGTAELFKAGRKLDVERQPFLRPAGRPVGNEGRLAANGDRGTESSLAGAEPPLVLAVGRLGDPTTATQAVESGKADFIALGRSLIADPQWVAKLRRGEPIRRCRALFNHCWPASALSDHAIAGCIGNSSTPQCAICRGSNRGLSATPPR